MSQAKLIVLPLCIATVLLTTLFVVTQLAFASPVPADADGQSLLALYILALDNDPGEPTSLTQYYTPTVRSILSATTGSRTKTAVILADLDGGLDTHILIAEGGVLTSVQGLPIRHKNDRLVLDESVSEWDVANGEAIGTFLSWATAQYPGRAVVFSFLGHGAPVVPKVNFYDQAPVAATPTAEPGTPTDEVSGAEPVPPLPSRWHAHNGFTDYHSASLLSVADLAQALAAATDDGAKPFKIIDLVQCFSSSIEELYELHPYAETIAGSPNYTYAKPEMVGAALRALDPQMSAPEMTETILATYDRALPVEGHPRLLVGVDSKRIPAIKEAWDNTSRHLLAALSTDADAVRTHIKSAYESSAKYDTTLCKDPDYQLAPPDAMSDMADFALHLSGAFGRSSPVGSWAITSTQRISEAIITRHAHSGTPWFDETLSPPFWSLEKPGIALFTDFSADGKDGLSWQAYWYTDTVSANVPHPFRFLQSGYTDAGWADVFTHYWGYNDLAPETIIFNSSADPSQAECEPAFLSGRGHGELTATDFTISTDRGEISAASSIGFTPLMTFALSVELHSQTEATNPQVLFKIYRNGTLIMAEVDTPGYMPADSVRQVQLGRNWEAKYPGRYEFEVTVDADERFIETNEVDNTLRTALIVTAPALYAPFVAQ